MKHDMTTGTIWKTLVLFTVPLVLSGMLQQVFNWVDAFIVGNTEGELALAGIGATTSLYNLFIMVITGFTSGICVLAAQQSGMRETKELRKTLAVFVILLGGLFFAIAAAGIVFTHEILVYLDTPGNIFETAQDYIRIMFLGVPFLAVYNIYCAVLRGMGDSRAPFLSVLVCSVINVLLDILFVVVLRLGAAGAAAATVISQGIMTIFILFYAVRKYKNLRFRPEKGVFDKKILKKGMKFALPPAIQAGTTSVGNLFLQRFMNGFGEQTVAAVTTAYRIDSVIILPIINFGSGIATMVGQNIGAGKPLRAKQALKTGIFMISGVSLCLTALVLGAGGQLIAMFGLTPESVEIGRNFFRGIAVCYIVYGLAMAIRGYIEGIGDMLFSGIAGIIALGVRIGASYTGTGFFGNMIIAYAEAFSWLMLLCIYVIRYVRKYGKKTA